MIFSLNLSNIAKNKDKIFNKNLGWDLLSLQYFYIFFYLFGFSRSRLQHQIQLRLHSKKAGSATLQILQPTVNCKP